MESIDEAIAAEEVVFYQQQNSFAVFVEYVLLNEQNECTTLEDDGWDRENLQLTCLQSSSTYANGRQLKYMTWKGVLATVLFHLS